MKNINYAKNYARIEMLTSNSILVLMIIGMLIVGFVPVVIIKTLFVLMALIVAMALAVIKILK